ncbi:MAG: TonB-dependent receptor plug domain-containing protein, partial [Candidatus Rokuibacteriota bacterium]
MRGPRFLLASTASREPVPLDVRRTSILRRPLALDLNGVSVKEALAAISRQAGLDLVYADDIVSLAAPVYLRAERITVAAALTDVLLDAGVDVVFSRDGRATLVRRMPAARLRVGTLTGRVTDRTSGQPVVAAQVSALGTGLARLTGEDGRYTIPNVPAGTVQVQARRIGYESQTQSVTVADGATATLDFALAPAASRLEDVVVTVTGEQRRLEVGNVIGTINADSVVREAPITSLSDLINARVPGVQVLQTSGASGVSPRIRIRGLSSLSVGLFFGVLAPEDVPLLVVDGVRADNSQGGVGAAFGLASGRFNDLNPEEIESIEIVKGPSAATLYGTDAANGVIVVKTKRGQPGRARWNVYAENGILDVPAEFPDNYFSWGTNLTTGVVQQCRLAQKAAGACRIDSLATFSPLNNSETRPFARGSRQQYGAQVSGGVAQFTYFLSGEYQQETGILKMPAAEVQRVTALRGGEPVPEEQIRPNALERINVRGNVNATLGPTADVGLSVGYVSGDTRALGSFSMRAGLGGPGVRNALDGWVFDRPGEVFGMRNEERDSRFTTSARANWQPLSWLTTRGTVGLDFGSHFLDVLQRRGEGPAAQSGQGIRILGRFETKLYSVDLGASASFKPWERLTSRTSVGAQYN